MTQVGGTDGSV